MGTVVKGVGAQDSCAPAMQLVAGVGRSGGAMPTTRYGREGED
jgi:hypothetical protein